MTAVHTEEGGERGGALPASQDRATHEQSPQAVSAVPVGIPSAVMTRPWCGNMAMVMLAGEADCGRRPLWPYLKRLPKWFDPSDWAVWPVISWDRREVHIVAIASARKGAFRRLVDRITALGLTPVVVGPIGPTMPAILAKWGWQETIVGEGWDRRDEWRPAQGTEAGTDETEGLGPQGDGPVGNADAPTPSSEQSS